MTRFSISKPLTCRGSLTQKKRMMGLEPTTSCMATRPDTPMLVQ